MSKDDSVNVKDFLIGTFLGGVIGAGAALLFAPKPGREIRQDIGEQTITVKEKGTTIAKKAKEKSTDLAKSVSDQSSIVVNRVKEWPIIPNRKPEEEEDSIEAETLREIQASQDGEEPPLSDQEKDKRD